MRIISQDRMMDIPYNLVRIVCVENEVLAFSENVSNGGRTTLGSYGSGLEATTVVNKMRAYYMLGEKYYYMPYKGGDQT